jgi:hypothetical protein
LRGTKPDVAVGAQVFVGDTRAGDRTRRTVGDVGAIQRLVVNRVVGLLQVT